MEILHHFISGDERARDSALDFSHLLAPYQQAVTLAWADIRGLFAGLAMRLRFNITDSRVWELDSASAPNSQDLQNGQNALLALENGLLSR